MHESKCLHMKSYMTQNIHHQGVYLLTRLLCASSRLSQETQAWWGKKEITRDSLLARPLYSFCFHVCTVAHAKKQRTLQENRAADLMMMTTRACTRTDKRDWEWFGRAGFIQFGGDGENRANLNCQPWLGSIVWSGRANGRQWKGEQREGWERGRDTGERGLDMRNWAPSLGTLWWSQHICTRRLPKRCTVTRTLTHMFAPEDETHTFHSEMTRVGIHSVRSLHSFHFGTTHLTSWCEIKFCCLQLLCLWWSHKAIFPPVTTKCVRMTTCCPFWSVFHVHALNLDPSNNTGYRFLQINAGYRMSFCIIRWYLLS